MSKAKQADLKVLRDFYGYPAAKLAPFGVNVSVNLDVKLFPNLPVPPDQIKLLADTLTAKIADRVTGGPAATAAQAKAFDALADALNSDANIVELTVGSDLETLLNTGYLPASTNRTSSPLDDTAITGLYNNGSTQLLLRLATVRNAGSYQVQVSTDGGVTWSKAVVLPQGQPDCGAQSDADQNVSGAGAGHRRQHGVKRLGRLRLHRLHLKIKAEILKAENRNQRSYRQE